MVKDAGRREPRIVAVINQKGGVGKTTSAVNLGAALAQTGRRVLMIDLDPQAHLSLHLGVDPTTLEGSVYDVLIDPDVPVTDVIRAVDTNLDLIGAETDLAAAESELAGVEDRNVRLRAQLRPVLPNYDVVLIDCPPSLGVLTLNGLSVAGEVMVPMQAHFLALQGVGKLLETIGMVCESVNPELQVSGIILCMHDRQTMLAREVVSDLRTFIEDSRNHDVPWRNCRVLDPPIRRNIKLAEAPSFGQTIFQYSPTCHGARDYLALASDVVKGWMPDTVEPGITGSNTSSEPCVVETPPLPPDRSAPVSAAGPNRDQLEPS